MATASAARGDRRRRLAPRRCNVSFTPQRSRCRGLAYPVQDFLVFLSQWDLVQGFIGFGTAYFIHFVSLLQCDLGVSGTIGEIGVAGGKSFAVFAFTKREGEGLLACDLFGGGVERDNAADSNLPMFLDLLESFRIPQQDVAVLKQSSLQLRDVDLANIVSRRCAAAGSWSAPGIASPKHARLCQNAGGFRLFHVDGGHYVEATFHDVNLAACMLVPGGVLLVDDLHNLGYPGVQEGFHRYMLTGTPPRRLEPFLYTGRLFLTTPGYAEAYRSAILRAHPGAFSREMYGVKVLTTHHLNLGLKEFEQMILGSRPRAGPMPRSGKKGPEEQ